jgi:uncharacterized membrane protein
MNESARHRWLLVSLALNLFVVGSVAGGAWIWWAAERPSIAAVAAVTAQPRGLRYAADELSAEQRRAFRSGLRDARREAGASIEAAASGRTEVLRLLRAPQLDRNAVAAALARTREADAAWRARAETSVVDFAATLSPDERIKLVSGLERRSTLGPPPASQPRP